MPLSAQFTIRDRPKATELLAPELKDVPIVPTPSYKSEYITDAGLKDIKRKKRKERNYIELTTRMGLSQTQFENWSSGGDNTLNVRAQIDFKHAFKVNKFSTETNINTRYGLNYIEKKKFKNEDEFKINLATRWQMHKNWSYSANGTLRSQFMDGYKNKDDKIKRSTFMAPGYLDLSVGITYKKKPLTVLVSPVGGSARFVLDKEMSDLGWHGVEKGKRTKWQAGPSMKINFDDNYWKNVLRIRSEMYSFTNIKTNPNFRWETTIDIKATKFLSTTIYGQLRYDELSKAEKPKSMQYRYSISVNLSYTFKNK